MKIFDEFDELRAELQQRWIDYYEDNRDWIKSLGLDKGDSWSVTVDNQTQTRYCPDHRFIVGVASLLDERVVDYIRIGIRMSAQDSYTVVVKGLGLRFDPEVAIKQREEAAKMQEAKLLSASDDNSDDPTEE